MCAARVLRKRTWVTLEKQQKQNKGEDIEDKQNMHM